MKHGGRLPVRGGSRFPEQRDVSYCEYVRSLGCLLHRTDCWRRIDAAHVIGRRGRGDPDRGRVVNLCRLHHRESEGNEAAFERKYGLGEGFLAEHAKALQAIYEGQPLPGWE